jgi:hypothetical protein
MRSVPSQTTRFLDLGSGSWPARAQLDLGLCKAMRGPTALQLLARDELGHVQTGKPKSSESALAILLSRAPSGHSVSDLT